MGRGSEKHLLEKFIALNNNSVIDNRFGIIELSRYIQNLMRYGTASERHRTRRLNSNNVWSVTAIRAKSIETDVTQSLRYTLNKTGNIMACFLAGIKSILMRVHATVTAILQVEQAAVPE